MKAFNDFYTNNGNFIASIILKNREVVEDVRFEFLGDITLTQKIN